MLQINQQIGDFILAAASEYAFPAELSVAERKQVKNIAEKFGLRTCSFGMGSDRRIHLFKRTEPVEYSVKNTFVDGPLDPNEPRPVGPAHQSMPVAALQQHIAAEEESFMQGKVDDSPRSSLSTADSDSVPQDPKFSIKNSFVHFEIDSKENGDPRIIQSMPSGMFADNIQDEVVAAVGAERHKNRPLPLSEDSETDMDMPPISPRESPSMVFPSTPNADMDFGTFNNSGTAVPWVPPTAAATQPCETFLPPACWAPPASSPPVHQVLPPQGPPQGVPQGTTPAPPQGPPQNSQVTPLAPAQGPPACFKQGTPVILRGLANQANFNGLRGTVSGFDASCGRYDIMLEIGPNAVRRQVKVKVQNLLLAPPSLPPQQPSVSRAAKPSLVLDQMIAMNA